VKQLNQSPFTLLLQHAVLNVCLFVFQSLDSQLYILNWFEFEILSSENY
jgi:hypothetical protein